MTEDRFEEFLRETAQDYHRPPETPRAEIWARVEAARKRDRRTDGQTGRPADGREDAGVLPSARRPVLPSARRTVRLVLAIAAVLALGVAIGRLTMRVPTSRPVPAPIGVAPAAGAARPNVAYQVVATQHLSRVEALLTELKTEQAAANLAPQARDLLSTTRLLLDSPRITDPMLRSLLQDVELVLVQLAQLSPGGRPEERALIDQGMAERQIRPRLRNAIPAGPAAQTRGET